MDEASQLKPEDAIGALARGGQAVIEAIRNNFLDKLLSTGGT